MATTDTGNTDGGAGRQEGVRSRIVCSTGLKELDMYQ